MKLFIALAFLTTVLSFSAQAQNYSSTSCRAYTQCLSTNAYGYTVPNGTVSCQVYGSSYSGYYGSSSSQCSWQVQPYASVTCQGFVRSTDYYGNTVWGWQNYHFRCPGM